MVKHLFALLLLVSFIFTCEGAPKHPVVLVPGLGASQLWKKKDTEKVYKGEWIYAWDLLCHPETLFGDMTLDVNSKTGDVTDKPGYTFKTCGFGNPKVLTNLIISWYWEQDLSPTKCDGDEVEFAGNSDFEEFMNKIEYGGTDQESWKPCWNLMECHESGSLECREEFKRKMNLLKDRYYFYYIIDALEKNRYTANKDIKGAPYDFRKAPVDQLEFFSNLKKLVEDLYRDNNNVPVVIIAHSMGNPVLLNFYNNEVTKEWTDKYIHAHVALAPPWAGAVKAIKGIVTGDSEITYNIFHGYVRPMERSWPSVAWSMPSPLQEVWGHDETLVVTPSQNYSVRHYEELFTDLGYKIGFLMWNKTQTFAPDLSKLPELKALHVLYGNNVDTPTQYKYPGATFPNSTPEVTYNKDGDGTVNKRSLEAFKKFAPFHSINLTHHAFDKVDHMEIIRDTRVLKFITDLVLNYEDSSADDPSHEREKTEL